MCVCTGGEQDGERQYRSGCGTGRSSSNSSYVLVHESLGSTAGLPSALTVAQLMAALRHDGHSPVSHVTLTLTNRRDGNRGNRDLHALFFTVLNFSEDDR